MRLFLCIGGNYVKTQKINIVTSDFVLGLYANADNGFC